MRYAPPILVVASLISLESAALAQYGPYGPGATHEAFSGDARVYGNAGHGPTTSVAPYPNNYAGAPAYPSGPYPTGPVGLAPQRGGYPPPGDTYGYPAQPGNPYPRVDSPPPASYGAAPFNPAYPIAPSVPDTGGRITALADLLVAQASAYLQAFIPKIGIVPESQGFLADGTALRDSAARFRDVAFSGAPPALLGSEFQNVVASWQRLKSRMARVNKGRIGPNIARNLQMEGTIEQIGQLLP